MSIRFCLIIITVFAGCNLLMGQAGKLKYPAPTQIESSPKQNTPKAAPRVASSRSPRGSSTLPGLHISMSIGVILPNAEYKEEMTKTEYLASPYLGAPLTTGKMGFGSGAAIDYMFYIPLNVLNKKMVTEHFDWGWNIGFEGGLLGHSMEYTSNLFDAGTFGEEIMGEMTGRYWLYGIKVGPNLSWIPGDRGGFVFEVGFRPKFFFHSFSDLYGSTSDSNGNSMTADISRSTASGSYDFCSEWAFTMRWPSFRMFLERTRGFEDNKLYDEVFYYAGNTSTQTYAAKVNLSYIRFGIGVNLVDASQ